ncbi:MAG TPA: HAD family hydrolase [Elusimicrobia bacterium]|nr:MAG: HAD family hydrolase [Elusimicrobia bacterium GWD2_63_28]HCC49259.1 HAD family hydrolase [Elusimicrobiota bacterium]
MAAIKAVIFDLDGVLVDAGAWHYQAFSRALAAHGFALDREEHDRSYDGLTTAEKLKLLSAEKGLPAELYPAINELKQRYTTELILKDCAPRREHLEMMAALKGEGYRLAVASNSLRRTAEQVLSRAGLLPYLEFFTAQEDAARPKPDPQLYLGAFARLGLRPDECLVLEDHPVGVKAAEAAGAHVARVSGPGEVCYNFVKRRIAACGEKS